MWEGGGERVGGGRKKETLPRLFDGNFANEKTMTGRQSQESEQIMDAGWTPERSRGGGLTPYSKSTKLQLHLKD